MINAFIAPLLLGVFVFLVQINLLESFHPPDFTWVIVTGLTGCLAVATTGLYHWRLQRGRRRSPPELYANCRIVFAFVLTLATAVSGYTAWDRGMYCLEFGAREYWLRIRLEADDQEKAIRQLEGADASRQLIEEEHMRLAHKRARLWYIETSTERVWVAAIASALLAIGTFSAWVLSLRNGSGVKGQG
jgi:hypothetical protein